MGYFSLSVIFICSFLISNYSWTYWRATILDRQFTLLGSTPADSGIREVLSIDNEMKVDFIRWELVVKEDEPRTFKLNINYGEAQPNTLGFISGGKEYTWEGNVVVAKGFADNSNMEIYTLKGSRQDQELSILKLNGNLFHILTSDGKLMRGNGGYSYTLNRGDFIPVSGSLFSSSSAPFFTGNQAMVVFEGRTPCLEISKEYNLGFIENSFKIKWKLTLFRDLKTNQPTEFHLQRTGHRSEDIKGYWKLINDTASNPQFTLLQIVPEEPEEKITFLVGDRNVLFFVSKKLDLLVGNADFSYTLNRRVPH